MLKDKWTAAMPLDEFIDQAEANQQLWRAMRRTSKVPAELADRILALPDSRYLLVLAEDWCGDAVSSVPVLAQLADEAPDSLELRVLRRDENLDLMDMYLSGTSRAIPVVIVLDEHFEELGWWGSRPRELQAWVESPEAQAMENEDRYRAMRTWYARDKGRSTLAEVTELIERESEAMLEAEPVPMA